MNRESISRLLLGAAGVSVAASTASLTGRLLFGLSMALTHGRGTLAGLLRDASSFPDPLGIGPELSMALMAFAEFFCALLIAAGLFCRLALLPLIAGMGTAALVFHHGDPFHERELALLYLGAFAMLVLLGPGKYSIDHLLFGRQGGAGERQ